MEATTPLKPKKVALKVTIEIDAALYAENEGIEPADIRPDIAEYVRSTLQGSYALASADAQVRVA